jgi:predicted alpha/beta-hydrolase family hydrolase
VHELPGESRERPLIVVPTPVGPAEYDLAAPTGPTTRGLLVLGHGAGGSIAATDLVAVAAAARAGGFHVARVRQPYAVAGRRAPAPADQLDLAWTTVVETVLAGLVKKGPGKAARLPLVVGGRSSGARVACRTAAATGARGVLALAFPLHPPGHPEKSRAPELDIDVPLLVLQGARDPFGTPAEFPPHVTIHEVAAADHRLVGPGFGPALEAAAAWLHAVAAQ